MYIEVKNRGRKENKWIRTESINIKKYNFKKYILNNLIYWLESLIVWDVMENVGVWEEGQSESQGYNFVDVLDSGLSESGCTSL